MNIVSQVNAMLPGDAPKVAVGMRTDVITVWLLAYIARQCAEINATVKRIEER